MEVKYAITFIEKITCMNKAKAMDAVDPRVCLFQNFTTIPQGCDLLITKFKVTLK